MAGTNTKMNISYSIKAVDKFSKVHKRLTRQLMEIEHHLNKLEGIHMIKVDADTVMAETQLERVEDKVEDIPRRRGIHIFTTGWNDFRRKMDRIADFSRDMGEIGRGMVLGHVFTAAAPLIQTLAGGLGALASAATPAAFGIAGLAAVAIPAFASLGEKYSELQDAREKLAGAKTEKEVAKATEELAAAQKAFSSTQMESVKALEKFNKFFGEFSKRLEKPVLTIFNKALETAQGLLTLLEPAIRGSAEATNNLFDAFNRNLEAEDMKAFFEWVNTSAKPNIEKLSKALGNFLAGFGNMMLAFDPLAQSFMDGFLNMSESFRDWAAGLSENKAFQDFLSMVQTNAPVVLEHVGKLITFLWTLIEAMAPFATWVLEISNKILGFVTALMQNHTWLSNVVGIILTFIGVLSALVAPIMGAYVVLKTLFGPAFSFVGKHASKLIGLFKGKMFKIISQLGLRLLGLATGPFGFIIATIIALAVVVISNWDAIWSKTKEIFGNIASWVTKKINQVKMTGALVAAFVRSSINKFTELRDKAREKMEEVVEKVKKGWNNAQSFLEGIDLYDIGADMIRGLINGIGSMAGSLVRKAKGVVGDAIEGAKNLLGIASPSKLFFEFGEFVDEGFINGMLSMTRKVQGASEKMTQAAVPKFNGYGKGGYAAPPAPDMNGDLRASSAETNRLLSQLSQQKSKVVVEIHGDNEAIRAYVNEQNAVDAMIRRF